MTFEEIKKAYLNEEFGVRTMHKKVEEIATTKGEAVEMINKIEEAVVKELYGEEALEEYKEYTPRYKF